MRAWERQVLQCPIVILLQVSASARTDKWSYIDVLFVQDVYIDKKLKPGIRVTVELPQDQAAGTVVWLANPIIS